jgi:AAA family ATP:ADP antiporter
MMRDCRPSSAACACSPDVQPGEGITAVVLFADVFLILCAYYLVKPLRDGWIAVSEVGGLSQMELKAYASFGQSLLLAPVVAIYARLSARWPRRTLITRVTVACIGTLVVFWLLQPAVAGNVPGAGIAFYLWVGMFGVFVVAQFWAFAADLYDGDRGDRLLPLIAIGATAGAAFGLAVDGKARARDLARQRRAAAGRDRSPCSRRSC